MRKSFVVMAAMASTLLAAQAAQANVTCEPGSCTIDGSGGTPAPDAFFTVTTPGVGPSFAGEINAAIGNTITGPTANSLTNFTDTFEFLLPQNGTGSGGVINSASFQNRSGDITFTSLLINGLPGMISNVGLFSTASAGGVSLLEGLNVIKISGNSRGTSNYSGTIKFTPAIPEMATWGMMMLGFIGMGAVMRRRRDVTVTYGSKRAFA